MATESTTPTIHLGQSIRTLMASTLLGNGSVRAKSLRGVEASFTISMDEAYDYNILGEVDPDDLHAELQRYANGIAKVVSNMKSSAEAMDDYLVDMLSRMVFSSNMIEGAGAGLDITFKLCRAVFQGEVIDEIQERDAEYDILKQDLMRKNIPHGMEAVLRSRREIIQHAKAMRYIIHQVCLKGEQLSEEIILEAHRILTFKVDIDESMPWTQYSGVYRQLPVRTGFHQYMDASQVLSAMREMIQSLISDLENASSSGQIDPVALAAKYCHIFVNIHPFLDGNGRLCRLILNALLLKYCGTLVCIGESGDDRQEYMQIASNASYTEGAQEDLKDVPDGLKPKFYKELASFTLRHARDSMKKLHDLFGPRSE